LSTHMASQPSILAAGLVFCLFGLSDLLMAAQADEIFDEERLKRFAVGPKLLKLNRKLRPVFLDFARTVFRPLGWVMLVVGVIMSMIGIFQHVANWMGA
jgi:hypothetical protein